MSDSTIKKALIQRLRRTHMNLARRVRLLDNEVVAAMAPDGELPPPNEVERQAAHNDALQLYRKLSGLLPLLNAVSASDTIALRAALLKPIQQAQALLLTQPSEHQFAEDATLRHFIDSTRAPNSDPDMLLRLARTLGEISLNNIFYQDSVRNFVGRCLLCLTEAEQALAPLHEMLQETLAPSVYHGTGHTIVHLPETLGKQTSPATLRSILGLPAMHPLLVLAGEFKNGRGEVIFPKDKNTLSQRFSLKGNSLGLQWGQDGEQSFLQLPETPGISEAFNIHIKGSKSHPFTQLVKQWDSQEILRQARTIPLTPDDLSDLAVVHTKAGVVNPLHSTRQLPVSLLLSAEQRWFVEDGKTWKLTTLSELATNRTQAIKASPNDSVYLQLPPMTLQQLQKGPLNVGLTQLSTDEIAVSFHLPREVKMSAVHWPNPALDELKLAAKAHAKQQMAPGYIDHRYSETEVKSALAQLGLNEPTAFNAGIDKITQGLGVNTLADISIWHTQKGTGTPYFASITLYSLTKQGPHIRRVGCCIHDPSWTLPTDVQLSALGMDAEQFKSCAMLPADAAHHLEKPFNQFNAGKIGLSVFNHKLAMDLIKQQLPSLHQAISLLPTLDRQALVKQEQLSLRDDRGVTLSLTRHRGRPVFFPHTPSDPNGIEACITNEQGRYLSLDGSASLWAQDGQVFLKDFTNGTAGVVGTKQEILEQIHSQQRPPNSQQTPGDADQFVKMQRVNNLLTSAGTKAPVWVDPLPLPPETLGANNAAPSLQVLWGDVQKHYRFDLSLDANLKRLTPLMRQAQHPLEKPIAGGAGGRQGVKFLRTLHTNAPLLFHAATMGKRLAISQVLFGSDAQTVSVSQATLTVEDWIVANIMNLHQHNPEIVAHYQLSHRATSALSIMEPTTAELPPGIDSLANWLGTSTEQLSKLYQMAYSQRLHHGQSFKSFLPSCSNTPLGHDSLLEHIALTSAIVQRYTPTQAEDLVYKHSRSLKLKHLLSDLKLPTPPGEQLVSLPLLQDHGYQLGIQLKGPIPSGVDIEQRLEKTLSPALRLLHLSNGVFNTIPKGGIVDPLLETHARDQLLSLLKAPANIASLKQTEKALLSMNIAAISLIPHNSVFQDWAEQIVLHAMGQGESPNYNRHFTAEQLKTLNGALVQLAQALPLTPAEWSRVESSLVTATHQYNALLVVKQLDRSLGHPVDILDKTVARRGFDEQSSKWQVPLLHKPTKEVLREIAETVALPIDTKESLMQCAKSNGNGRPSESLASQIYSQVVRELQLPPPLVHTDGIIGQLQAGFKVSAKAPMEYLLERREYQHCRHGEIVSPSAQRQDFTPAPPKL